MNDCSLLCADARRVPLANESVQCVVTSPPYWGLRRYAGKQELVWGGDVSCAHEWLERTEHAEGYTSRKKWQHGASREPNPQGYSIATRKYGFCRQCEAWRGAYGLEPTVGMYVAHTVEILREIRRVLRQDGVAFWNIADSYYSGDKSSYMRPRRGARSLAGQEHGDFASQPNRTPQPGLKPKDLCLIPQRVAIAVQDDGWWVRSDIIWSKPNPMPESARDRPTDAYEHILVLTKSERYYWDRQAVSEPLARPNEGSRALPARFGGTNKFRLVKDQSRLHSGNKYLGTPTGTRNIRNVWDLSMQPYKAAHFATFPERLPRLCILAASRVGDLVLDPFAGSGTTGRAAVKLRRRCVLLDLAYDGPYLGLSRERTRSVQLEAFA